MSHTTTYQHVVTNVKTFCEAARAKGYKVIEEGVEVSLYGSNKVSNAVASIHIPGWRYQIAITQKGELMYDHFGSAHGTMEKLHELMQDYNVAVTLDGIPMDIVQSYQLEELENGDKEIVLEYE